MHSKVLKHLVVSVGGDDPDTRMEERNSAQLRISIPSFIKSAAEETKTKLARISEIKPFFVA
jgi:hypothetical protein